MDKNTQVFNLKTEFITLGQLIKCLKIVSTGGEAKEFLSNNTILVNKINENRRGRKLYKGDVIQIEKDEILLK